MDCAAVKILVSVTANTGENPVRRKHTVFPEMIVSGELADPKRGANHYLQKGSMLKFMRLVRRRGDTRCISDSLGIGHSEVQMAVESHYEEKQLNEL